MPSSKLTLDQYARRFVRAAHRWLGAQALDPDDRSRVERALDRMAAEHWPDHRDGHDRQPPQIRGPIEAARRLGRVGPRARGRAQDDEEAAFAREHLRGVHSRLRSLAVEAEDRDELAAASVERGLRRLRAMRARGQTDKWIAPMRGRFDAARLHVALRHKQRRDPLRRAAQLTPSQWEATLSSGPTQDQDLAGRDLDRATGLRAAEAIRLRQEAYSNEEIAEVLNISLGTLKREVAAARAEIEAHAAPPRRASAAHGTSAQISALSPQAAARHREPQLNEAQRTATRRNALAILAWVRASFAAWLDALAAAWSAAAVNRRRIAMSLLGVFAVGGLLGVAAVDGLVVNADEADTAAGAHAAVALSPVSQASASALAWTAPVPANAPSPVPPASGDLAPAALSLRAPASAAQRVRPPAPARGDHAPAPSPDDAAELADADAGLPAGLAALDTPRLGAASPITAPTPPTPTPSHRGAASIDPGAVADRHDLLFAIARAADEGDADRVVSLSDAWMAAWSTSSETATVALREVRALETLEAWPRVVVEARRALALWSEDSPARRELRRALLEGLAHTGRCDEAAALVTSWTTSSRGAAWRRARCGAT